MPEYKAMCCAGALHLARGQLCEDWVSETAAQNRRAVALCDGAAHAAGGGAAAAAASTAVAQLLAAHFPRYLHEDAETVRREAALAVHLALQEQAWRMRLPSSALECTVLAAAMNDSGDWLALHLGDGEIWSRQATSDGWQLASGAQKGLKEGSTCLTMACGSLPYLHLCRKQGQQRVQLLLLTDGAAGLFRRANKPDLPALQALFLRAEPLSPDDYSFAWLSAPPTEKIPTKGAPS